MKLFYRASLTLALLLVFAVGRAGAHAYLDRSIPADGERLMHPPKEIQAWFTESLVHRVSTLRLLDESGAAVDGTTQQSGGPNSIKLTVGDLAPGTYTVSFQVLSVDTHVTEGSFKFTVAGDKPAPAPEPTPEPTPTPDPTPPPQPDPTPERAPQPEPEPEPETPSETPPAPEEPAEPPVEQKPAPPAAEPKPEPAPAPPSEPAAPTESGGGTLLWVGLAAVAVIGGGIWFLSQRKRS